MVDFMEVMMWILAFCSIVLILQFFFSLIDDKITCYEITVSGRTILCENIYCYNSNCKFYDCADGYKYFDDSVDRYRLVKCE